SSALGTVLCVDAKSRCYGGLDDDDALSNADRAHVAVPALNRMLLGVAVATQQLDAVQAHDHAFVGGVAAGKAGLAVVGHALVEAGCAAQHDQETAMARDA